jgi:hypothetical protein
MHGPQCVINSGARTRKGGPRVRIQRSPAASAL